MILPNEKRKKLEELLFAVSPDGKKLESYQSLALGIKEKINELAKGIENAANKEELVTALKQQNAINKEISDNIKELEKTINEKNKKLISDIEKLKEQPTEKRWGSWGVNYPTSIAWGSITGTLSNQTDLQSALNALVPYTGANKNLAMGNYNVSALGLTSTNLTVDTNSLYVDSVNHRLGIGTTSPASKLDVNGGVRVGGGSLAGSGLSLSFDATAGHIQTYSGLPLYINEFGNNVILLLNGGNIGIGTTAPNYKLEISGTTATSGIRSWNGLDIYEVPDPTTLTGAVSSGGSVDTGQHWYAVTYTTAQGETHPFWMSATTTAGNNTVTLTIPVSTDPRVTGRKLYRTKAGTAQYSEYYLATISNNTTTTYVDTAADSTLTGSAGVVFFRSNNTAPQITIGGTKVMNFDTQATYLGVNTGSSITSGGRNTFIGVNAGLNITTASENTVVGYSALTGVAGGSNSAFGTYTLKSTTGSANSSFGSYSMFSNTTGNYNTANGYQALYSNTTGGYNTANGYQALYSNTTGGYNAALGYNSGRYIADGSTANTTSTNSVYLGYNTKASASGDTNEIVIGYNATGLGSNTAVLGNSSITTTVLQGNVGVGTTAPSYKCHINGILGFTPGSSVTPANNGDIVIEATSNTSVTIKLKGSDGTIRSVALTLS